MVVESVVQLWFESESSAGFEYRHGLESLTNLVGCPDYHSNDDPCPWNFHENVCSWKGRDDRYSWSADDDPCGIRHPESAQCDGTHSHFSPEKDFLSGSVGSCSNSESPCGGNHGHFSPESDF